MLKAIELLEQRFPYYKVKPKTGFFWYYLQSHDSNPPILLQDLKGFVLAGEAYAGGDDSNGHLLINGPLEGLGKISVFAGSREILIADARRLSTLMEAKGRPFHYREYEDMIHAWMLHFPESKKVRAEIVNLILSSPPAP